VTNCGRAGSSPVLGIFKLLIYNYLFFYGYNTITTLIRVFQYLKRLIGKILKASAYRIV